MMQPTVAIFDYVPLRKNYALVEAGLKADGIHVVHTSIDRLGTGDDDIANARAWLVGHNHHFSAADIAQGKNLRGIVSFGIGVDMLDLAACDEIGLLVGVGAAPENIESMAESTVMFLLNLFYGLDETRRLLRENQPRPEVLHPRMLKHATVGLVGFGRIAQAVAERLRPFGCTILVASRQAELPGHVRKVGLDELLAQSDAVSVHVELNDQTANMLDRARLEKLKPGAFLINVSRGGIVDEEAVADLSRQGRIGGIAFDTYKTEPLPPSSPLREVENAILTPHMVGHTRDSLARMTQICTQNLAALCRDEPPVALRNPHATDAWKRRLKEIG